MRQANEVTTVRRPNRVEAVDPLPPRLFLVQALEDHPGAVGGHIAAPKVETRISRGVEEPDGRSIQRGRRGTQRIACIVRDPELAAVGPPLRTRGREVQVSKVRAIGPDRVPMSQGRLGVPVAEEDLSAWRRRYRRNRRRAEGVHGEREGRHGDDRHEQYNADPLVPLHPRAVPLEPFQPVDVEGVDGSTQTVRRTTTPTVGRHASSSPDSARASRSRPSCRCFLTVPDAMPRICAISPAERSSR